MSGKADYRKLNDGTGASSTYHKKDGTNVRSILNRGTQKQRELQEFCKHCKTIPNNLGICEC